MISPSEINLSTLPSVPLKDRSQLPLSDSFVTESAIATFTIVLTDPQNEKRLSLFLTSQGVPCEASTQDSTRSRALITDSLELATRSRLPVVFIASTSLDTLPAIAALIGCVEIPYSLDYFAAYLKAVSRGLGGLFEYPDQRIILDGLEINRTRHQVFYQSKLISLPPMEFAVLEFIAAANRVVSSEEISKSVWGYPYANGVRVSICKIKKEGIPIASYHRRGYTIATSLTR